MNLTRVFLLAGLSAFAAALLLNVPQGRLLAIGRPQVLLVALGLICFVASSRVLRSAIGAVLRRSREASPATRVQLQRRPALYFVYGLWFASIVGLGEAACLTCIKLFSFARPVGFEYMWQVPMGYAIIFLTVALAFVAVRSLGGARVSLAGLIFAGGFIGLAGLLPVAVKGVVPWAVLLFAAGAGAQLMRTFRQHAYLWHELVRRTVVVTTVLAVGLAAGFYFGPVWTERRALAQLPAASRPGPNVLLLVLDTVRAQSLSLHGYQRATSPHLDRFAARGVVFDQAFSTAPWTLPAHGSMFTGRYPHELSAASNAPLDGTYPTLAEVLGRSGYLTAGFVANYWYGGAEFGLSRGFTHYEDHKTSVVSALLRTSFVGQVVNGFDLKDRFATIENARRKSAEDINRDFLGWLSRQHESRPFFAFLNYLDVHAPYLPPDEFAVKFSAQRPNGFIQARPADKWSAEEIQGFNDAYDGGIAYLDEQLGRLFAALEQQGILRNTVVVVTSDHGEHFGEHKLLKHQSSLYLPLLQIPLVVVYPDRVPAGSRRPEFVSLRDLPATILDLAGLPNPSAFPGKSLLPAGVPAGPAPEVVLAEVERMFRDLPEWYPARRGSMKSVLFGGLHFIRNYGDGLEELYDVVRDPQELHDLSGADTVRLEQYRAYLKQLLSTSERKAGG